VVTGLENEANEGGGEVISMIFCNFIYFEPCRNFGIGEM